MSRVFFTSDLHVGHANVIRYSKRPFKDVDEMDAELVRRWNSVVQPEDHVYVVGDFALCHPRRALEVRRQLRGTIYLVLGNHDKGVKAETYDFAWVKDYYVYKHPLLDGNKQNIVLFHYAMRVWDKAHHGAWAIYGHSHGSLPDDPNALSLDIGVDNWDYTPVSFEQIQARMAQKTWKPVDHHGSDREDAAT